MSEPLVVIDADVLGRRRTGDETYVTELLRALPSVGEGLRFAAITRHPELVPTGIEPITLPARSQELRMAVRVPLLLRRLRPALVHFVHSVPLALPCPAVLTVQDLSFEHDRSLMGARETAIFRFAVPRSARRARRVLAISQRTKDDLVRLYALAPAHTFRPGSTLTRQERSMKRIVESRTRASLIITAIAIAAGASAVVLSTAACKKDAKASYTSAKDACKAPAPAAAPAEAAPAAPAGDAK